MSYIPEGFSRITPYLLVEDAEAYIAFLRAAFGAEDRFIGRDDEGAISHAEVTVAGGVLEVGQPSGEFTPTRVSLHIYVPNPDAAVEEAVAAGATLLYDVTDHAYGERSGGVSDRWGNQYYLASVTDHALRSPNS